MMKTFRSIASVTLDRWIFVLGILLTPQALWATAWQATAGEQTTDEGIQALAFLANELWVHVGDSITCSLQQRRCRTIRLSMTLRRARSKLGCSRMALA